MAINYEEVLNDVQIIDMYNKVDLQNNGRMQHGYTHMKNTLEYMKKLTEALNFNSDEKNKIFIAVILHDVGQVTGRENHGEKASIFAEGYLKNKLPNNQIAEIMEAIKYHSEVNELEKYSFETILLSLADKMDVSKARVDKKYMNQDFLYKHIENVDFTMNNANFDLIFNTDKSIKIEDFFNEEKYSKKIINIASEFAKRINRKLNIYLNNEVIFSL